MKLSYSQTKKQYIISKYNPVTKRVEIVDSSPNFDEIGVKHGFLSQEDKDEEFDPSADEEE